MAKRIKGERFSPVDAAWWHMESPTNMAMITGVFMFDEPIDLQRLKRTIECRMLVYDRFRMRVKEPLLGVGTPRWEPDPHFHLDAHIHRIALPSPGGQAELHELVGDLMSTPLDYQKPLWQMHLVENYGSGCALISRLHHCIADGLALVQLMLSMADCESDQDAELVPTQEREAARGFSRALGSSLARLEKTIGRTETLISDGLETIGDPNRILDAALLGYSGTRALGKLVLTLPDHKTLIRGRCGVQKRAAWSRPLKVSDVKAVGKAYDGTINDTLISCVAGALGRYLANRGEDISGVNLRAMVPVNLRKPDEMNTMGNRFGLVILSLPVGVRDAQKRLTVLKQRMDEIKSTPEAVVAFGLLNGIGLTPIQVEKLILRFFASKVSGVMTNVPGPREGVNLCGRRIRQMMFWVPTPGNLPLGVSIISYAGEVIVGVATDAKLAPDPETIVANFEDEFSSMRSAVAPSEQKAIAPARARARLRSGPSVALPRSVNGPDGHEPARCLATTQSGRPCRNRALAGEKYCALHRTAAPETTLT